MNDDLAPARGCIQGALIGTALWAAIVALIFGAFFWWAGW